MAGDKRFQIIGAATAKDCLPPQITREDANNSSVNSEDIFFSSSCNASQ